MHRTGLAFLIFVSVLAAQGGAPVTMSGDVANVPEPLIIEAVNNSTHMPVARVFVERDGHFALGPLEPGSYELRVRTEASGHVLRSEFLEVHGGAPPVSIHLPRVERQRPISGVVSYRQLTKERSAALKLLAEARRDHDVEKVRRAIGKDPAFAAAHHELAIHFLALNRPWDARNALLKTIELEPSFYPAFVNLAVANLVGGNAIGAGQAALRALELQPGDGQARYLLEVALWLQGRGPKPSAHANSSTK
jgi:hypothetical protein